MTVFYTFFITATNSLLKWDSCHPRPLVKGIPRGQFLRLRHYCSDPGMFKTQARELNKRFLRRGYPPDVLNNAYENALKRECTSLLTSKQHKDVEDMRAELRILGVFGQCSYKVRQILAKHWDILQSDAVFRVLLLNRPLITF